MTALVYDGLTREFRLPLPGQPVGGGWSVHHDLLAVRGDATFCVIILMAVLLLMPALIRYVVHRERVRIARELHDTVLQGAQGLLLVTQSAIRRMSNEETGRELRLAMEMARATTIECRNRINVLRSADDSSLDAFLDHFPGSAVPRRVRFIKEIRGTLPTDRRVNRAARAVIEQAVANAVAHGSPSKVILEIEGSSAKLLVAISDNGQGLPDGLDEAATGNSHWGIIGMRERAGTVGGCLRLTRSEDGGTRVEMIVPVRRPLWVRKAVQRYCSTR